MQAPFQLIDCEDKSRLDERLEAAPAGPAVFAIWAREGEPYVGRTALLQRRLKRLLKPRAGVSRLLNLRDVAVRVEFRPVASRLEGQIVLYETAKAYLPDRYLEVLKLRMPPYVKLTVGNKFPRTHITTRLAGAGQYYGPFRSRGSAELFEHDLLNLFQIRRCQDDLVPSPDHPGCIYGEMNMCLRPCQESVGVAEYGSEALRVSDFLRSGGRQLLQTAESARDRLSAELDFEGAARQHKRVEQIQQVLERRDELAADVDRLFGIAVTRRVEEGAVNLWFLTEGSWQPARAFSIALADQSVSMDRRLRELVGSVEPFRASARDRQEHLAILARWFYSSWRDGEWLSFESLDRVPYRKLVGAISRVA